MRGILLAETSAVKSAFACHSRRARQSLSVVLAHYHPGFLANRPHRRAGELPVYDKHTGEIATRVALADPSTIEEAIAGAAAAAPAMRALAACERAAVLQHGARRFQERAEELALALCIEAGKPIQIGDVPSFRVDHMPYGGVKDSGFGREGLRFSIEDMTEIRLLIVRTP